MQVILLILVLVTGISSITPCQAHIADLVRLFALNKTKFYQQVHGYALYSGKMVNDLGLPQSCNKYPAYSYFTGQARGSGEKVQYRVYLGLCFSSKCTVQDIDQNAGFFLDTLLNLNTTLNATMSFTQPSLTVESTPGEIVFLILFCILMAASLKETVFNFFKNCKKEAKKEDQDLYGKYAIQFGEEYDPTLLVIHQNQSFFKKFCIVSKMHEYFTPEQSSKIISFSAFRIIAIPLAFYGYLFYLCNIASYNYMAFIDEVYESRFSKIAVASYYIPDALFFISGFLLAKKAFALIDVEPRASRALYKIFLSKVKKWFPIYWAFILIYWQISPTLHAGPVWYEYQDDAAVCDTAWWRSLLFIDNWFQNGCYNFAWYIPVQIQLSLLGISVLWVYLKNKKVGFGLLVLLFVVTWILTLTLSAPFPSSLDTTLSYDSQLYFKSTYSHMPYYLLGIINGFLAHNQTTKQVLHKFTQIKLFRMMGLILGSFLILLVVVRPSVWQGVLRFQLGLAKTGMFFGVYLLMFWNMFGGKTTTTLIHRLALLSKGVLLLGGIVVASFFWGGYTFPYIDGQYLLNSTVASLLIAIPVGSVLIALFLEKPFKEQQMVL